VATLVGKTWRLHLEKVVRVDREENLAMIAESVAFLVAPASASSTTPSTSSTPGATTRPTRWRA
jgi:isopropylmalate/homocitrate/citramalate synthase